MKEYQRKELYQRNKEQNDSCTKFFLGCHIYGIMGNI